MAWQSALQPKKMFSLANIILLVILISSLIINQVFMTQAAEVMGLNLIGLSQMGGFIAGTNHPGSGGGKLTGEVTADAIKLVISSGQPVIYGSELNVSFDTVQASMNTMSQMDPTYGRQKITLTGDALQRYITVGLKIACEYCCGATGLIDKKGQAACGCAHSQAMRGLLAYLIQNHGSEYTNDQLLRELARWKSMYFPKQMIQKMASQLPGANFTPDTASLLLDVKLPNYGQGHKSAPLPSDLNNLPNMVGGC